METQTLGCSLPRRGLPYKNDRVLRHFFKTTFNPKSSGVRQSKIPSLTGLDVKGLKVTESCCVDVAERNLNPYEDPVLK